MKRYKIILVLVFYTLIQKSFAQNWDYVNFQSQSQSEFNRILGATIDDNDNIYTLEQWQSYQSFVRRIIKKYSNGILVGTSSFNFGVNFDLGQGNGANAITSGTNNIYLVGSSKIYKTSYSLSTTGLFKNIIATNGTVELHSIQFKNNELYISGVISPNYPVTNTTVNFGNNCLPVQVTQPEAFFAKYSINGTCLLVKKAGKSGGSRATDIVIDNNGNIYVTYISLDTNNLNERTLKRFDLSGNFDVQWGTKKISSINSSTSLTDIKIDPDDSSIYIGTKNKIFKYETASSGNLIQTKDLPSSVVVVQLNLNNCNAVGVTGITSHQTTGTFYSSSYNKNTNGSNVDWTSNGSSSGSDGISILTSKDGKFNILGNYNNVIKISGQQPFTSTPFSITKREGTFIGRINNSEFNSGAKAVMSFVNPNNIIQKNSKYGIGDVAVLCLSDDLLVDGSDSSCEDRYFIGLSEFDLNNWNDIQTLHSDWVQPLTSAPNNIKITDFIPQGYQLKPNIVYKLTLAVGIPWHATHLFFMIDCC